MSEVAAPGARAKDNDEIDRIGQEWIPNEPSDKASCGGTRASTLPVSCAHAKLPCHVPHPTRFRIFPLPSFLDRI